MFKNSPIHTNGNLPKKGTKAPDFLLVTKDLENRSLKDYKGKKKLLSVNPSLDTPVCSTVAKTLNEKIQAHPGVCVLVISADLPFAQKRFCSQEKIDNILTLSTMRGQDFAKNYGVLIQDGPLAGLCARAILVLDENDLVTYTELVTEITQEPKYAEALSYL